MSVLNNRQIRQKLSRLAYEIIEQNSSEDQVYLAGINNNGLAFAELLVQELKHIKACPFKVDVIQISLNPADPTNHPIVINVDGAILKGQNVIIVDDVANTGRTIFYAFKPFMELLLKKLQVAVLVDRKHKSFPIEVEYVGLTLATTFEDHIEVNLTKKEGYSVQLS